MPLIKSDVQSKYNKSLFPNISTGTWAICFKVGPALRTLASIFFIYSMSGIATPS